MIIVYLKFLDLTESWYRHVTLVTKVWSNSYKNIKLYGMSCLAKHSINHYLSKNSVLLDSPVASL